MAVSIVFPHGAVSTIRPLLPFTVSTLPFGASTNPSGSSSTGASETVIPPGRPKVLLRHRALGTAAIRLLAESATYSVPFHPRATPVGPITSAAGSVCSAKPEATTVCDSIFGFWPWKSPTLMRTTVPPLTTLPGWSDGMPSSAATVPLSTLVTNKYAVLPMLVAVMSHGPLMAPPAQVSTSCPWSLSTSRQPGPMPCGVPASPGPLAVVGRLPTTTHPPGSTDSAVVRPIPPGHGPEVDAWVICANCVTVPSGISCTIVVPVPCALAASLKLLTRTPPCTRFPMLWGTATMP